MAVRAVFWGAGKLRRGRVGHSRRRRNTERTVMRAAVQVLPRRILRSRARRLPYSTPAQIREPIRPLWQEHFPEVRHRHPEQARSSQAARSQVAQRAVRTPPLPVAAQRAVPPAPHLVTPHPAAAARQILARQATGRKPVRRGIRWRFPRKSRSPKRPCRLNRSLTTCCS
jgi:hypothetical protein